MIWIQNRSVDTAADFIVWAFRFCPYVGVHTCSIAQMPSNFDPNTYGHCAPVFPPPLPLGWTALLDPASGKPFYHNAALGTTSWDRPQLKNESTM